MYGVKIYCSLSFKLWTNNQLYFANNIKRSIVPSRRGLLCSKVPILSYTYCQNIAYEIIQCRNENKQYTIGGKMFTYILALTIKKVCSRTTIAHTP